MSVREDAPPQARANGFDTRWRTAHYTKAIQAGPDPFYAYLTEAAPKGRPCTYIRTY